MAKETRIYICHIGDKVPDKPDFDSPVNVDDPNGWRNHPAHHDRTFYEPLVVIKTDREVEDGKPQQEWSTPRISSIYQYQTCLLYTSPSPRD